MSIFSRRKRLLNRTPRAPKMSSRRQFHRALRRHPAWPAVMEQAAARARAQKDVRRDRTSVTVTEQASSRAQVRRALRRNRSGLVALIAVGALVALLNGIGAAHHSAWFPSLSTLSSAPTPRFGHATVFDQERSEMLLFGGFIGLSSSTPTQVIAAPRAETWGWNGQRWINRNPNHQPSARGYTAMAYDAARKVVVLFGGFGSGTPTDDTWIWNGVDWTQLDLPISPPARQKASMVYDAHRKVVVMFGGVGTSGIALNDTWVWNGTTWKRALPPLSPTLRHSAAMAYDLCRGEAVLFGGAGQNTLGNTTFAGEETWTWNGTTWTQETPLVSPTPRSGAGMTYSPESGRIFLYGGLLAAPTGNQLVPADENSWTWDGVKWEKEFHEPAFHALAAGTGSYATLPPPRAYPSFVYDLARDGMVLFAGSPNPGLPLPVALGDMWNHSELFPTLNTVSPIGCPNPVPIPPDQVGDQKEKQDSKTEVIEREDLREVGRLPVLLGTNPKEVPAGAPPPDCPRSPNEENVYSTYLTTNPKRQRVYQFFQCYRPSPNGRLLIQAYDATTLRAVGSTIANIPALGTVTDNRAIQRVEWPMYHDQERGLFYLRVGASAVWILDEGSIEKGENPVKGDFALPAVGGATINNVGFFNHPKTGRAKLLVYYWGSSTVTVLQFDIEQRREDWRTVVGACAGQAPGWQDGLPLLMRAGDRVYTYCNSREALAAVVRIPIVEAPNDPPEDREEAGAPEIFPGPVWVGRNWGDPGAERVTLLSDVHYGQSVWTFDGKASRYVGRSGMSLNQEKNGHGFAESIGRLYMLVPDHNSKGGTGAAQPGGIRVLDTRLTPVPQPINYYKFTHLAQAPIAVYPPQGDLPRRIFVRRAHAATPSDPKDPAQYKATADTKNRYADGEIVKLQDEMHYLVIEDHLEVPEQGGIAELDANTLPIKESPDRTEANFDAEGSSYGFRLRSVGGISSATHLPPQGGALTTGLEGVEYTIQSNQAAPPCLYPDRELVAGWVGRAHLSDLETSALTSGLEVDSNTKGDLEGPISKCIPPKLSPAGFPSAIQGIATVLWPLLPFAQLDSAVGSGSVAVGDDEHVAPTSLAWNRHFKEVECVGDSENSYRAAIGDVYGLTTCKQKEARVEAIARGALGGSASEAFSVGEGYSNVVVKREPERGVVVTSTAWAKAIKLPSISIDLVKTEAVVWSNGRPGEKRATFTRKICGVNRPDSPSTVTSTACLSEENQQKMVNDWNKNWGINSKMTLPAPDADYFKGSPGGYLAGVTKPVAAEIDDQLFSRDFQREVGGLEIIFYKDSLLFGPGRQVLQLAAVRAITGYGVQCQSHLIYSPSAKDCVALAEDNFLDEFEEEGEFLPEEETEFDSGGSWEPVLTDAPAPLALGSKIGRFLENLPLVRLLPIRQMGEALLAASVWLLLGLPLLLASQRFAMNRARGVE